MESNTASSRRIKKTVYSKYSVLIYILVFLMLMFFFYRYYDKYKDGKTHEIQKGLISVAELKIHEIDAWRFERIADGRVLRRNVIVPRVTEKILKGAASKSDIDDILSSFKSFKSVYSYTEIKLIDTTGEMLLSDSAGTRTSSHVKNLIQRVLNEKRTIITDFHYHDIDGLGMKPHLDVLVPVQFSDSDKVRALVVMEVDPEKFLYPLIQSWPADTKTAETVLFENDGSGNALFLSRMRYNDNAALNFKVDKSQKNILAIQALNGKEGFLEGLDYRGVDVLGFCAKIKDSDWYLIAKIDRDEAYSDLNKFSLWFLSILFLILIIFVYVFSFNYKRERANYFKELYKIESEKKSISDNYKYVVENANDAILMTNISGEIVNANERAVSMYQYSKEEILGMNITDLQPDEKKQELREYVDHVTHENGHIFETVGLKKDGTVFPIESSSRLIEINGDKFVQSIIRDITVKKKSHDLLVESERRFSISFHNNPAWLTIVNLDTFRMIEINDAWTKAFGFTRNEALGKTPPELGIYTEEQFKNIINEIKNYKSVKNREIELKIKKGETRTMLVSRELITIKDVEYLYAMGLDITERKKAEDEIRSRELLFRTTLYSIGDGVITTDEKGLVQRMNNVAENLTGWRENEAEGKKLDDVFMIANEDSQGKIESPVQKVLKEGLIVGLANHTILFSKDGKRTPIADSGAPIKTAKGDIIGVVLVFRDQTEEREKEEELLSREAKFRSLFENTLEGIALHEMVYDSKGNAVNYRVLEVNNNFTAILGIEREKAVNVLATELYDTPKPPFIEIYSKVAETQRPYSFEVFFEPLNKHFAISVFSPREGQFATAFSDITGRKIASEILRASEERYRRISSTISDIAYSCVEGKEGAYSLDWMTGGVEQVTGYALDEVMAKKCWSYLVFEDDLKLFGEKVTNLEPGKSGVTELRLKRKDGGIIWIESRAECVLEQEGNKRIYGGIIDITDRKKAEDAIKETENFFSTVFRGSPNAMLVTSAENNKFVDVNDVFLNDLGYSREDIIGKTSKDINLFFDYSEREKLIRQVMEKGYIRNSELTFRTKTGGHLPALISMTLIHRRGKPFLLSNIVNLSDIKTAEDKLRKSEDKYRRLHESITDAVIMADMAGNLIEWNNAYRDMLGYSDDELCKLTYVDITPEKWHEEEAKIVNEKIIGQGDSGVYQKEYIKKDGTIFPVELRTFLIKDDQGKPSAMWAVIRDITERKQFEEALIAAKEKAEEMNRLKSNFLANMSHELRTPMTGILGFSEMLSEELEDRDRKQMAEVIYQGGKRLMNTLNLILNLSKLESETLTASLSNVNLSELAVSSVRMYEVLASEKNLKLVVDVDKDVCADLDEQFASQVFGNLVQNAIIYTNQGFVSVTLKREFSGSGNFAVLKVRDTGIGIKKEHQQIIFEPFRQVSEGFNRSYEGTGLGLTITKKYVELMNGSISVESEPGKGTVFTVKFPLLECNTENEKINANGNNMAFKLSNGKSRILIVEDDESNAKALEVALKEIADLSFAGNGEDALEMIKSDFYNLIIMDIGLPGISGLEAVGEIRKLDAYKTVPVIAVSAYAMVGDRETFLSRGCSHYISKPFSFSELKEAVNKLLNDHNGVNLNK